MDDHRYATPADIPAAPRWRWSASDLTLLIGMPLVAYLGGVGAAMGSATALILVAFAALVTVTFTALRTGRRNQPRLSRITQPAAVFVAVITIVTGWNLFQFAPHPAAVTWLAPAVPVALFAILVALMRGVRR